ncbi:MAG: HAMP domain-containing sensor histidine kinase [Candidatus Dormibacteria bacterium]|jgi:signal transduction histidine kinase
MARRAGCCAGCGLLVLVAGFSALVWLSLNAFGLVSSSGVTKVVTTAALGLCVIAAVGIGVTLRRVAPPVGDLIRAARQVEDGDYSARVPIRGPREVRSLARAFNAMSTRLEAEEARRRSVLADITHELRTPLTVIRSQAEAIADGVNPPDEEHIAPIVAATRALESLADDLRTLSLSEAGALHPDLEPVDVDLLVNETIEAFRTEAASAAVRLDCRLAPELPVLSADPAQLRRVLGNLIANALAHTATGGTVRVEASPTPGGVRITVRDDGEGIPPELLPRVFERFVKGPTSTGSGLGLAIVRDLVEAHGGSVVAESTVGLGTAIQVTLPG